MQFEVKAHEKEQEATRCSSISHINGLIWKLLDVCWAPGCPPFLPACLPSHVQESSGDPDRSCSFHCPNPDHCDTSFQSPRLVHCLHSGPVSCGIGLCPSLGKGACPAKEGRQRKRAASLPRACPHRPPPPSLFAVFRSEALRAAASLLPSCFLAPSPVWEVSGCLQVNLSCPQEAAASWQDLPRAFLASC